MAKVPTKQLLVEGTDDLYAIVELMKKNGVDWPDKNSGPPPVFIKPAGGVDRLMTSPFLGGELKQPELEVLGIMIDADDKPKARWSWFRHQLDVRGFRPLPADMPGNGLIVEDSSGLRVGLWLRAIAFQNSASNVAR